MAGALVQYLPYRIGQVDELCGKLNNICPTIGLLAGSASGSLYPGVVDAARELGVNLIYFAGQRLQDPIRFRAHANILYELVDRTNIDGLIVKTSTLSSFIGREAIQGFCERYRPLPIVSVGMALEGIPSVVLDDYQGMRDALVHLVEVHDCRRLAFVRGMEGHPEAEARYRAYLDVVQEYDLGFDPDLVSPYSDWLEGDGERAVQLFLDERKAHFDAMVTSGDAQAFGAVQTLQARGIHVPEDVLVTGFSDLDFARASSPALTTVQLRMYERGWRAVKMLLAIMRGASVPECVRMPTSLVVRQSCGCLETEVLQAAAEPEVWIDARSLKDGLLPAEREHLLLEMTKVVGASGPVRRWAGQLLDAFLVETASESKGSSAQAFLTILEKALYETSASGGEVTAWQEAISVLRRHTFLHLIDDGRALLRAESLCGQARVLIGKRAQQAYAYQGWQAEQRVNALREIGQVLTTLTSLPELMDTLAQELPCIGIPGCYLSLYETPQAPTQWSRLHLAYNASGRADLGKDGRPFPSRQLVPDGTLPTGRRYSLVIEALHFREEQLGFVLFEVGQCAGDVYDILGEQISNALRNILLLVQNVRLYQEALEAQREAEEANRLKSRFLSMVSHELRTPLSLLVGLSEVLLREQEESEPALSELCQQDLARIHISARQLDGLIRDVLDLARSQVGQLRLVKKPLMLGEVLDAAALVGERMAREKGLNWRVDLPEELPWVLADRTRLQQVVLNLVGNAVKFTPQGKVKLSVEVEGEKAKILISDTGLGVPVAEQEAIFDEFRQSGRTTARGYGGLGIGLALCRRLIELHGGTIGVQSSGKEGGGSTFTITLPTLCADATREPDAPSRSNVVLLMTARRGDDAPLLEHLMRVGFEVQILEIDKTTDWLAQVLALPPGAVVLDFEPASEQGWELMEALKGNRATEHIPVFFYSLLEDQDKGSVLTMDYLSKPLSAAALARALQRQGLVSAGGKERKSILVVDDDPHILDVHARMVRGQLPGCHVRKAANGRQALAEMQRARPDLVLLDLMMPELDGFGVLEAMQENRGTRDIPVIVLTAHALKEGDMARLKQGVAAVLAKGLLTTEETLAHVENALAHDTRLRGEMQWLVRKAMAYIHEHYAEPLTRVDLARHVGLSPGYLTYCFRQEMGITPVTYVNRYRIKQAKALLRDREKNVTEVALEVGFSGGSYFGRVFRREEGVSPTAYRRGSESL